MVQPVDLAFTSPSRAAVRLLLYLGFTLALIPVQAFAVRFRLPLRTTLPQWYHKRCARLLGLDIVTRGQMSEVRPTLFASNHVTYLDITVLGALIPGSFVAKSEVGRWPLFGWLAKLQRSVFIDRHARRASEHRDEMMQRLEAGDNLILFPEGTSNDGNQVLPFKSALFSVAERRPHGRALSVQPVSIAYTRLDGVPMGRFLRPFVAWYGDMDMLSHMWNAMGLGRITVEVEFHPLITLDEAGSRKALSERCYDAVARGLAAALAGRPQPAVEHRVAA